MSKREMVDTGSDKWHVRRDPKGRFSTSVDVGRSLSANATRPRAMRSRERAIAAIIAPKSIDLRRPRRVNNFVKRSRGARMRSAARETGPHA